MREQRGGTKVLRALEALRRASSDLLRHENPRNSPAMRALLELESHSEGLLRGDPDLHRLSLLLSRLRDLSRSSPSPAPPWPLLPFRRSAAGALASTAASIASEIQSWIDRESLHRLSAALRRPAAAAADDELLGLLACLESRVGGGFDGALQAALLRSGAFPALESALADPRTTKHVRDGCAAAVAAVVRFNRDVFVARAAVARSLVAMATPVAARALRALVAEVGGPLVDEMEASGEIPRVAVLLGEGAEVAAAAAEVVMEVGFHGRKEAVEALLEGGVVERLVALQREAEEEEEGGVRAGGLAVAGDAERRPLAMCAARFALMVEVGEGLRQAEKRAFRSELVRRVRVVASDAYAASIVAEILWGTAT